MRKRIGNSREPNVRQMLAMAYNLRDKFKSPCVVELDAWAYNRDISGSNRASYGIWISDIHNICPESWEDTLREYRKLMKG